MMAECHLWRIQR